MDVRASYAAGTWTRLQRVRTAVDPHGLFLANHAVPPLGGNSVPGS